MMSDKLLSRLSGENIESCNNYVHPEKRRYTKKEKILNFLYYYKWWLVLGAVVLVIIGQIMWSALGIGVIRPDYQIACVMSAGLSEDSVSELENAFAELGEDLNGDGRIKITINQYISGFPADPENEAYYEYASDIKLQADIINGDSYFFIMEDPKKLQKQHQILADADGCLAENSDFSIEGRAYLWNNVPALANMELSEETRSAVKGLYFGRRGYYDTSEEKYIQQNNDLWRRIFEEAAN